MPRKTLIGISLLALVVVLAIFLLRKNDGMTIVQRDIAESLERAKTLKAKRDSVTKLEEGKRFPKAVKAGEAVEAGEAGPSTSSGSGEVEETGASTLPLDTARGRLAQGEPSSATREAGPSTSLPAGRQGSGSGKTEEAGASTGSATGEAKETARITSKTTVRTDKPSANDGEFVGPPAPVVPVPKPESKEQKTSSVQKSGGSASIPAERFFTTSAMDGLSPQEKQSVFKPGQHVFIYAGIHAPQEEQVRLEWIDTNGKVLPPPEYVNIQNNTGANGYRIYKQRQFQKTGKYEVRLYNGAGEMIGKAEFTIAEDF